MTTQACRLPSRKWSIVALGSAGMATVVFSYLLAVAVAIGFFALAAILLGGMADGSALVMRLILAAFGAIAGATILWSLIPNREDVDIHGVRIHLSTEPRLAKEIESISAAMGEPMPTEVYLLGDTNAFVVEQGGRRIMGLGLPLLQMLTIAQFRAVLAHEFGHYYAGDTRLGPWVYNTRRTMARMYENLGHKSKALRFLTRWWIGSIAYQLLMGGMRLYWQLFMRITQAISRQQEFRSDELACYVAGSQALIGGLEGIQRCAAAGRSYWSLVMPFAVNGYQPQVAEGFRRFMNAPHVVKAAAEFVAKENAEKKPSPLDTHPPMEARIAKARLYNLPVPDDDNAENDPDSPMISLINGLGDLECALLKKFAPSLENVQLKPLTWDAAGMEALVPMWRKQVATFAPMLSKKILKDLPALVKNPQKISDMVLVHGGQHLDEYQREARARDLLHYALALCLIDGGWTLLWQPGDTLLQHNDSTLEPRNTIADLKSGKLTPQQWESYCAERGMSEWPLAAVAVPAAQ